MTGPEELKAVDGLKLSAEHRAALRPGEAVADENGTLHHLPRFFFEVPTWEEARSLRVATHFTLSELITVDSREADLLLRTFPHYVPCAILALARYLEDLRREVDAPVFISANGGYRSPAHRANRRTGPHSWGTAADIYRIGDTHLDDDARDRDGVLYCGRRTQYGEDNQDLVGGVGDRQNRVGGEDCQCRLLV